MVKDRIVLAIFMVLAVYTHHRGGFVVDAGNDNILITITWLKDIFFFSLKNALSRHGFSLR
jgi:hypothetical protein